MQTITLKVKGMTCGGCVAAVERVLGELDGVGKVAVSLERGEAAIEFDRKRVSESDLGAAIEDAGYEVVS
jgi:copper chaperone